jgi:hypothetical protein
MICAVRAMHTASPTDVPPNFITCNRGFIALRLTASLARLDPAARYSYFRAFITPVRMIQCIDLSNWIH